MEFKNIHVVFVKDDKSVEIKRYDFGNEPYIELYDRIVEYKELNNYSVGCIFSIECADSDYATIHTNWYLDETRKVLRVVK